jgi:hypothetical protein
MTVAGSAARFASPRASSPPASLKSACVVFDSSTVPNENASAGMLAIDARGDSPLCSKFIAQKPPKRYSLLSLSILLGGHARAPLVCQFPAARAFSASRGAAFLCARVVEPCRPVSEWPTICPEKHGIQYVLSCTGFTELKLRNSGQILTGVSGVSRRRAFDKPSMRRDFRAWNINNCFRQSIF